MTSVVVLLNGASASGKSRLIAGSTRIASEAGVLPDLRVARRFTTRAERANESLPDENRYLTHDDFEKRVSNGTIDVAWRRDVGAGRVNRYGFALARELAHGETVVLSGNNYLCWPNDPVLRELRRQGRLMVVRVMARDETRRQRLQERMPRLEAAELESRMRDLPARLLPRADHVIPNDPEFQRAAEWEFLRLVAAFRFQTFPWGSSRVTTLEVARL